MLEGIFVDAAVEALSIQRLRRGRTGCRGRRRRVASGPLAAILRHASFITHPLSRAPYSRAPFIAFRIHPIPFAMFYHESFVTNLLSRILRHVSLIPYPSSRIPHPVSLITYPSARILHRASFISSSVFSSSFYHVPYSSRSFCESGKRFVIKRIPHVFYHESFVTNLLSRILHHASFITYPSLRAPHSRVPASLITRGPRRSRAMKDTR